MLMNEDPCLIVFFKCHFSQQYLFTAHWTIVCWPNGLLIFVMYISRNYHIIIVSHCYKQWHYAFLQLWSVHPLSYKEFHSTFKYFLYFLSFLLSFLIFIFLFFSIFLKINKFPCQTVNKVIRRSFMFNQWENWGGRKYIPSRI